MQSNWALALAGATLLASGIEAAAVPSPPQALKRDNSTCQRTKVAILGAGVAGITAAQALSNASITDFLIVDRNSYIGGRVTDTTFGTKPDGTPYTVELGANWVQGLGSPDGPENPIWTLAKKYAIDNTYSDYDSLLTYDEGGEADFGDLFDDFDAAYEVAAVEAGRMLTENLQDTSARTGLSLAGWKPQFDMRALAVEWWGWDFNAASPPEDGSLVFGVAGENLTFNYFSDENNFVWDQRGFNTFVQGEAHEFLEDGDDDPRLLLDTLVTGIAYTDDGVVVHLDGDAGCIEAEHAITTFSLGVLQNDVVEFDPPLPDWKREAIAAFVMGTYTKIFFQFNETFWDPETEYFLYADPHERGRYPVWQSIDAPGFVEGSHIIFVTVTNDQSYVVEQQTDEETKAEAMEVLRAMFPDVDVPEPIDFMYPRWTTEEFAYGSYSNWPVGVTLEKHQNLRANVDRLWFAGEATSAQFFGFLQGAWFEGQEVGRRVASVLGGDVFGDDAGPMESYEVLHGTTFEDEYNEDNGWDYDSFEVSLQPDEEA